MLFSTVSCFVSFSCSAVFVSWGCAVGDIDAVLVCSCVLLLNFNFYSYKRNF
jgi:hypothetical protein